MILLIILFLVAESLAAASLALSSWIFRLRRRLRLRLRSFSVKGIVKFVFSAIRGGRPQSYHRRIGVDGGILALVCTWLDDRPSKLKYH